MRKSIKTKSGLNFQNLMDRLFPIGGFGDQLHVAFFRKHWAHSATEQRVIIHSDDADSIHGFFHQRLYRKRIFTHKLFSGHMRKFILSHRNQATGAYWRTCPGP